jgi:ethanolamine permease
VAYVVSGDFAGWNFGLADGGWGGMLIAVVLIATMYTSFVNSVGLAGLVASFFSIIFAYSRQLFALSRSGYLPRALSMTSSRKVPTIALIVPAIIGFLLAAITEDGATMLNIAVFGATVSYVLMMLAHLVLRRREPDLDRGYRTPGGVATSGVALALATPTVVATFLVDVQAAVIAAISSAESELRGA